MIGKVLAALIGARMDRGDGDSGIKGAALGVAGEVVIKRVVPVALLITGVVVAKRLIDNARGE